MIRKKGFICLVLLLLLLLPIVYYCALWHKGYNIRSVNAGESHSLVLVADGSVWGWGSNYFDQLGADTQAGLVPTRIRTVRNICAIETGANHTVALDASGAVWTWGTYGTYAMFRPDQGDSIFMSITEPILIPDLTNIAMIAAGKHYSLALDTSGGVWAWGANDYGQLGDGTTNATRTPVRVDALDDIVDISAGAFHGLAVRKDGTVWGWGDNKMRQLGLDLPDSVLTPTQIKGLEHINQASGGFSHSVALADDGRIWVWGIVDWSGIPDTTDSVVLNQHYTLTPFEFPSPISSIDVESGHTTIIVLLENGQVWAWGSNNIGQLGNGTESPSDDPIRIVGLPNIKLIAAGNGHNIAVDESGALWGWGANDDNQLGASSLIELYLNISLENHPELSDYVLEPRKILNNIEMTGPEISCP